MVDVTTAVTGLTGWIPTVDAMDGLAFFAGDIFENVKERGKGQVTDLAAPQLDHAFQVEGFKEKVVKLIGQGMSQFEEPVFSLAGDMLVKLGKAIFQAVPVG